MSRSPEQLLQLLQRHLKQINQVHQIQTLLITNGYLLPNSNSNSNSNSNTKWITTLLYNTLIRAHLNHNAILLFTHMLSHQAPPNAHTFPSLIKSASSSPSLGRPLHSHVTKRGLSLDPFILTSFVSFYAQFGTLAEARKVFEEIPRPCICIVSTNSMLDAFGKNGDMGSALTLFESMSDKDVVSWTSMINGFGRNGCFEEAILCFGRMVMMPESGVMPNEATLVSVLSSIANSDGARSLYRGKQIHAYILKNNVDFTAFLSTALISMYGKTGCLGSAIKVFNITTMRQVCTWNAMICSLSSNGREKEALAMFENMKARRVHPNEVTFVAVLTSCARSKSVELGLRVFHSMSDFHVVPRMEHYGCVVDLLGRAGLLDEATKFVQEMPCKPDATVLGALLGACKLHGNVNLASDVGRKLIELQPQHCGRYVVLSNIYAEAGKWSHAAELRKTMVLGGINKNPAYSWIDST